MINLNRYETFDSLSRVGIYGVILFSILIFGFPIYWMAISSISTLASLSSFPPNLIPAETTFQNYARLFFGTDYLNWLINSLIITSMNIGITIVISTLTGYGLARLSFPYKTQIARLFLFTYMFPPIMLGIPYYVLYLHLGLLDTYIGVVLAHAAITLPFTIWLMWQFFQTVPIEWEESAWICGMSRIRAIFEVAVRGALPGIIASAIFAFAISWNDYTFALILLRDRDVLTTGMTVFMGGMEIYWGIVMAGVTLLVLPPFVLVLLLNKYILEGFSVSEL